MLSNKNEDGEFFNILFAPQGLTQTATSGAGTGFTLSLYVQRLKIFFFAIAVASLDRTVPAWCRRRADGARHKSQVAFPVGFSLYHAYTNPSRPSRRKNFLKSRKDRRTLCLCRVLYLNRFITLT